MSEHETAQEALDILEDINDSLEETLDELDLAKKANNYLLVAVAVGSLVVGAVVGYFVAKKRLQPKYARLAAKEIEDAKSYYAVQTKTGKFSDPVELAKKYVEGSETQELTDIIQTEQYDTETGTVIQRPETTVTTTTATVSQEVVNVFSEAASDRNWNYEEELRNRTEDAPYIIHHDEFMASEKEYEQSQLTYYKDDDVLADENDRPVDNSDYIVGDDNLLRFGHGSKDNNIVYIRNEAIEHEFEVVRFNGSYTEHVLGFKHSDRRPLRKFRNNDD